MSEQIYIGLITLAGVIVANVFALCTTILISSARRKVDSVERKVVNGSETLHGLKQDNVELAVRIKQWRKDQKTFHNEVRSRLEKLEPEKQDE